MNRLVTFLTLAVMTLAAKPLTVIQDFPPQKIEILQHACTLDGNRQLQLDTRKLPRETEWVPIARTVKGILKPNTKYRVTFKVKAEFNGETTNFIHLLCRPHSVPGAHADTMARNIKPGEPPQTQYDFRFTTGNKEDYAFQIHVLNRLKATFSDFTLQQLPANRHMSARENPEPYNRPIPNLPTGAKDFTIDLPRPENSRPVLYARNLGVLSNQEDNALPLQKAILECKRLKASKLIIDPGIYRCTKDVTLTLDGMDDFTLDGGGATFVAYRTKGNFLTVRDCNRILIKNFKLDWDWEKSPLASIVKIIDTGQNHMDCQFIHYDDFPKKDMRLAIFSAYDPVTKSVGFEGGITRAFQFFLSHPKTRYQWLSPNSFRIQEHPGRLQPGQLYRLQHFYYDLNAIRLIGNTHLTLQDIHILSTPGHAITVNGPQHHWQFLNVKIKAPEDDERRVITCTADHTHVVNSKGFFKMIGCEYSLGADDCLNVHDCSGFCHTIGPRTVRTFNAKTFGAPKPGTPVELRQGDYSPANFISEVESVKSINPAKGIREITFKDDLPQQTHDGFIMFNRTYGSNNVILKDCFFHDNRARGVLLLAHNITIDSCHFRHHESGALKIETGYTYKLWSEGYGASNIVVKNSTFEYVNPAGRTHDGMERDVYIGVYLKTDPSGERTTYPILSDILFQNNTFIDSSGLVAFVSSTDNVIFDRNTFINRRPRKKQHAYRGNVFLTHSSNFKFINNTYVESPYVPQPGIILDPSTTRDVILQGNRIVPSK